MRQAFTMIELVFVIVMLGILAAVAIPKLAATRSDAEVSVMAQNIMTGAGEIASYAMAKGTTLDDLSVMSNAISILTSKGAAVLDTDDKKATIALGDVADCVTVEIATGVYDENLTISFGASNGDVKCESLQNLIDAQQYPMQLRGQLVRTR